MNKKVLVTGIGAISAIGNSVPELYNSLINSRSGITDITFLDTRHKGEIPVGEVKLSNKDLCEKLTIPYNITLSRTSLLAMLAAKEAVSDANLLTVSDIRTGFISATSVGGMDKFELYFPQLIGLSEKAKVQDAIHHDCGFGTEQVADYLCIKGFISTISTACSSSANSIMLGARLIKNKILDRVIVGGTDSLTKFTLNGFNTLMILDREHCKPFDENRQGLNLGEAAAFLVLESGDVVGNKKVYAAVSGFANALLDNKFSKAFSRLRYN